jgi:hypothetical protein
MSEQPELRAGVDSGHRIVIAGYTADEVSQMVQALRGVQGAVSDPELVLDMDALVTWLEEQAADSALYAAVLSGPLSKSPLESLMGELIRRARA